MPNNLFPLHTQSSPKPLDNIPKFPLFAVRLFEFPHQFRSIKMHFLHFRHIRQTSYSLNNPNCFFCLINKVLRHVCKLHFNSFDYGFIKHRQYMRNFSQCKCCFRHKINQYALYNFPISVFRNMCCWQSPSKFIKN